MTKSLLVARAALVALVVTLFIGSVFASAALATPMLESPAVGLEQSIDQPALAQDPPPGPRIDPTESQKADDKAKRNKIIAGVTAAVLLGLVIWGRHLRHQRQKKLQG